MHALAAHWQLGAVMKHAHAHAHTHTLSPSRGEAACGCKVQDRHSMRIFGLDELLADVGDGIMDGCMGPGR